MQKVKLRCYVCGKPIHGQIALVSPSPNEVDRVFVCHPEECLSDVQEDNRFLVTQETQT
jgi:aspartate carbamoyltransferase regulatory subunit